MVLPIVVLEELDKIKNDDGERGTNARETIRLLEQLRQIGNLFEGITLQSGGTIKIEANFSSVLLPHGFHNESNDSRILKVCKGLMEKDEKVILVTKDIIVRLKSQMLGITAGDFTTEQAPVFDEQYTGRMDVYTSDKSMSELNKKGIVPDAVYRLDGNEKVDVVPEQNQFFIIRSETSENKTMLGRFNGEKIVPLKSLKEEPFGVKPKNVGQRFLQEALMQHPG